MIVRRVPFRGILLVVGLGAMTGCGDGTGPLAQAIPLSCTADEAQ